MDLLSLHFLFQLSLRLLDSLFLRFLDDFSEYWILFPDFLDAFMLWRHEYLEHIPNL